MIEIRPGDLLAIEVDCRYYYAIILDRIRLFGGHWTYAFHLSSAELLAAEDVLGRDHGGFHAFIDFIFAKRENRITRLARKVNTDAYNQVRRLKRTLTTKGKAKLWFISDMTLTEIERVDHLTEEQKGYPLEQRIDDTIMADRIKQRWVPEMDPRI